MPFGLIASANDTSELVEPGRTVSRYGGEVGDVDVRLRTLLDSPVVAIGTLDEICDKLRTPRDTMGFNYFVLPYGFRPADFSPIVERLTGT